MRARWADAPSSEGTQDHLQSGDVGLRVGRIRSLALQFLPRSNERGVRMPPGLNMAACTRWHALPTNWGSTIQRSKFNSTLWKIRRVETETNSIARNCRECLNATWLARVPRVKLLMSMSAIDVAYQHSVLVARYRKVSALGPNQSHMHPLTYAMRYREPTQPCN